jgi:transcriptional regulator with XRE-family HTH domain
MTANVKAADSGGDISSAVDSVFGANLRRARRSRDLSQGQLATRVGLSRVTIANMEGGKQHIQLHHVFLFAKGLDVPIDRLLPTDPDIERHRHGVDRVRSDYVALSDVQFLQESRELLTALKGRRYDHDEAEDAASN